MKKLSLMFAALAIVFAVSSAFTTNHKSVYQDWFRIDGTVSVTTFQSTAFDDLATYEPAVSTPDGCSSEELTNVCAAQLIHTADVDELQQSDLTSQSYGTIVQEIRYKN